MSTYVKYMNEINPKNFEIGQIVFYIDPTIGCWHWGRIREYYSDGYGIEHFEFVDDRLIDGVPIAEYPFGKEVKKLPKNWSYDTELFTITHDHKIDAMKKEMDSKLTVSNIEKCIESGLLVSPLNQHSDWAVRAEIEDKTYRIIHEDKGLSRTHSHDTISEYNAHLPYACVNTHFVFATLEEALKPIKEWSAEAKRRQELSDYDESIEEMEKVFIRWKNIYNATDANIESARKFLVERLNTTKDGVIDVRLYQGRIQWADSKSRWKEI